MAKSEIVPSEIITYINNIPRNTAYFFPKKKKRSEYSCNVFRDDLDSLLGVWNNEIYPMTEKIRTPGETEHKAYVNYMSYGIMEHDEAYAASIMDGVWRTIRYDSVIKMIYGQYIHFIGSTVEYSMIKVLEKNGHSLERINRASVYQILKDEYETEINKIPNAENYNKFYALWNFLKHNSISSYESVKRKYPDILIGKPFRNGEFALWYVHLDEKVILETLNGLKEFFDSFCETVFSENVDEADWNYDEYFLEKCMKQREYVQNPLDLP